MAELATTRRKLYQSKERRLTNRDGEGRVRYHHMLVAVIGQWRSGKRREGDYADEVAWRNRTESIENFGRCACPLAADRRGSAVV
jgi:hypothetical protein